MAVTIPSTESSIATRDGVWIRSDNVIGPVNFSRHELLVGELVSKEDVLLVDELVSKEDVRLVEIVVVIAICGVLSLFGILANIINVVVFVKQGFKDSINISLCADLGCVLTMLCMSCFYSLPLFDTLHLSFDPLSVLYMTVAWPHVCCARISSCITAFITLERCLCVTIPLKVKTLVTPFRTKIIISSIFAAVVLLFCPFYFVNKLEHIFIQPLNRTVLVLVYTDSRILVETITFAIHSVALATVTLLAVVVSTAILVVKLNQKTKWRDTSVASKPETTSLKDKKVVKMVTLISSIFLTCYTPATINFFLMAYEPRFSHGGEFGNAFFVVWSCTCLVQIINFSINIFVYYNMSSKFKSTFLKVFKCKLRKSV